MGNVIKSVAESGFSCTFRSAAAWHTLFTLLHKSTHISHSFCNFILFCAPQTADWFIQYALHKFLFRNVCKVLFTTPCIGSKKYKLQLGKTWSSIVYTNSKFCQILISLIIKNWSQNKNNDEMKNHKYYRHIVAKEVYWYTLGNLAISAS